MLGVCTDDELPSIWSPGGRVKFEDFSEPNLARRSQRPAWARKVTRLLKVRKSRWVDGGMGGKLVLLRGNACFLARRRRASSADTARACRFTPMQCTPVERSVQRYQQARGVVPEEHWRPDV